MKMNLLFFTVFAAVFSLLLFTASIVFAQSVKLPAPQTTGGVPTLEAIEKRASAVSGQFPTGEISRQELSCYIFHYDY